MMCREIYVWGVSLGRQICESAQRGRGTARGSHETKRKEPSPGPVRCPKRRKEPHHQRSHQGAEFSPGNKQQEELGARREHEHLEENLGEMQCCSYY